MNDALHADVLLQAARAQVPDGDDAIDEFRPALEQLLTSLREQARLEARGVWVTTARLVASLVKRRRLAQLQALHPQLREPKLPAPIFILGFPRTGTTLLHNLLASDPSKRAVRLWEMREPFAPEPTPDNWAEQGMATTARMIEAAYQASPRLADIHPLRAGWPDECSWLFRNCFSSMVFGFHDYVPGYLRWLEQQDMRPAYADFARALAAITYQRPGAPLLLKDPCHLWHLDALFSSFPDARVIHLHRDPREVLPSFCSLMQALHAIGSQPRPSPELGAYAAQMLATGMQRMLTARAQLDSPTRARIIDLHYRELIDDPLLTLARLHAQLGLEFGEAAQLGARAWLQENRGLSGRHHYSLEQFGLDGAAVQARFAAYTEHFATVLAPRPSRNLQA